MKRRLVGKTRRVGILSVLLSAVLLGVWVETAEAQPALFGYYSNVRRVVNLHDYRLRVKGRVQLNTPGARTAVLDDEAWAFSSCDHCQSLAVALQVNLISPAAVNNRYIIRSNALNYRCSNCTTIAVAMQYNYITDDWRHVPRQVHNLISQMNRDLQSINRDHLTLDQAVARVNAIIAQFQALPLPASHSAAPRAATAPGGATQPGLHVKWSTAREYTTPGSPAAASE